MNSTFIIESAFSRIRTEYGEILPNAGKYEPEKLRIRTLFHAVITFGLKCRGVLRTLSNIYYETFSEIR